MFTIAEPYARFEETAADATFERAAGGLQEFAERVLRERFGGDYGRLRIAVVVRIESGSTRVWVAVGSVVGILTLYGDIRQSVDYLVHDAKQVGAVLLPHIPSELGIQAPPKYRQRRTGLPGRLQKLFEKVKQGKITAEEATRKAVSLLQKHADTEETGAIPELATRLSEEFAQTELERPSFPQRSVRKPTLALPPRAPRRRRRGVIATRDALTGELVIRSY